MEIFNIEDFKKGWLCGDFEPSLFRSKEVEVAHQFHPMGYIGPYHYHCVATEYNYIVRGKVFLQRWNHAHMIFEKQGWIVSPKEYFITKFLEDTDLIVIKTPSLPNDKYDSIISGG